MRSAEAFIHEQWARDEVKYTEEDLCYIYMSFTCTQYVYIIYNNVFFNSD